MALPEFRHTERDKVADGGEDKDTAGFGEKETGDPPVLENGEVFTWAVEARTGVAHFRNASDEEEDKEKEKTDNGERGTPPEHLRSPASDNSTAQRTDKIGGHIARKRTVEIQVAEHDGNAGHDGCEHHRNQQCL